ncbi:MAG: DUF5118 domain-containing protein, partial [Balneolales bacterium]|nr:DUF5118 domain-containing protein [Balneolales bacterium]
MTSLSTIKTLIILSVSILLAGTACQTTDQTTASENRPSSSQAQAIPAGAQSDEGLFTVHQSGNKIFFEIPNEMLGRDMAIMSRIAKTAEGLGWGGDRLAGQQVVQWERRGDKILLRGVSYSNTADENLPIYQAV